MSDWMMLAWGIPASFIAALIGELIHEWWINQKEASR
jgi:hypothetical protein